MRIVVNGEKRELPGAITVEELLARLEIDASRVAVELNRNIVRKADWGKQVITDGSQVEIVHFVGGGAG